MILSEADKEKERNRIYNELRFKSPSDENFRRVKIDKDILEELLFLKIEYADGEFLKLPVWGGKILENIDLSEIQFDDVSFSLSYDLCNGIKNEEFKDIYDLILRKIPINNLYHMIYYGNTNAHIDFKKTFEFKKTGKVIVHGVNLSKTDLSNNDIDCDFDIVHGYFCDTKMRISRLEGNSRAFFCDFTGIDLSMHTMDISDYLLKKFPLYGSSIRYTDINFIGLSKKMDSELLSAFLDEYSRGEFDGCNINGVLIKSECDLRNQKYALRKKYFPMDVVWKYYEV